MKYKYNPGEEVVHIYSEEKVLQVEKGTIDSVVLTTDKVDYYVGDSCTDIPENELYTHQEAIEFLTNYINKTEE